MSFGTDIYGSPFGAPDVESIDAIAYAQGVVLYVADDFVEDGYTVDPIPVTVSSPIASATFTRSITNSVSSPAITVSAAEPTLNVSSTAHTQGQLQYLPNGYLPDGYFEEPQRVIVSAPTATASERSFARPIPNEAYADLDYVAADYIDDALQIISISSPLGVFKQSVTVSVTDLVAVVATAFAGTVSTSAVIAISDLPQVSVSAALAGFEGDVRPTPSIPSVTLTPAEATASAQAAATYGALLVSATAPIATAGIVANRITKVSTGENYIKAGFHAAGYFQEETATVNVVTPTSNLIVSPTTQVSAPAVTVSAPLANFESSTIASAVLPSVTVSAPDTNEVIEEFPLALPQVVIGAPVANATSGAGATANTLGADLYVDANYVDAGYTDDPIEVTITSPDDIVTSQPATTNVTIGTVVVSAPQVAGGVGFAVTQVSSSTVLITNPEVAASGTASIDVAAPGINVSSPQVNEVVSEFPLALLPVNVSPAQVNATGTANADIDLVEVQVAAIQAAATGTASVQVTAVTVEVQSPEVLETIDEFPLALPGITVSSPEVSAAGTANTSVSCPSVAASSPEAEISGQGLVVIAEVELTTITTVSPISQANVIVYVAATEVGVNPSAPTVTAVPTAAPTAPAVSVSAPAVQINVVERPEDLQQINVASPTAAAFEFSVDNLDLLRQIKVENEVRKIILEKEIRVIKVSPVGG